jgi:hypothetical protein
MTAILMVDAFYKKAGRFGGLEGVTGRPFSAYLPVNNVNSQ